ncbi:class E sortase [Streptomyces sp. NPDC053048]|uniref:class E sortase n=1 Tax=Streptomyces sp. NPDC053048 TaxID=3365694 RepID=UPI0037D1ED52
MGLRLVVRTLSELCLTIGTLIVLFVVYVLYWTGVRADSAMEDELSRLRDRWAAGPAPAPGPEAGARDARPPATPSPHAADPGAPPGAGTPPDPGATPAPPPPGSGQHRLTVPAGPRTEYRPGASFAVMRIPRFGAGWVKPVLQGTGTELLKKGLGHYERTAGPGEQGNFAVAGHRRTYGDPFKDLDELRPGDAVVIGDGTTWFTYRVDTRPYRTLPGDTAVIDPVPAAAGYRQPGRYLTLTTCDPEWGHSHRLIVWGHLAETRPVGEGGPTALSG